MMIEFWAIATPFIIGIGGATIGAIGTLRVVASQVKEVKIVVKELVDREVTYVTVLECNARSGACKTERRREVDTVTTTVEGNRIQRIHEIENIYQQMNDNFKTLSTSIVTLSADVNSGFKEIAGKIGEITGTLKVLQNKIM